MVPVSHRPAKRCSTTLLRANEDRVEGVCRVRGFGGDLDLEESHSRLRAGAIAAAVVIAEGFFGTFTQAWRQRPRQKPWVKHP